MLDVINNQIQFGVGKNIIFPDFDAHHYSYRLFLLTLIDKKEIVENEEIMMWINGHTHLNKYTEINGTTCMCNPRGYPDENYGWKPLVIDL